MGGREGGILQQHNTESYVMRKNDQFRKLAIHTARKFTCKYFHRYWFL